MVFLGSSARLRCFVGVIFYFVGCSFLKRSLMTGVSLNMRFRYRDFRFLVVLRGTYGRMFCGGWGGGV